MTISHRQTRSRSSNSTAATENTISTHNEEIDDVPGVAITDPNQVYLRGPADLPPAIPNVQDRPLLTMTGKTQWIQDPPPGEGRTPSSVLTVLLKKCHPGLVEYRGKTIVASSWKHYQAAKDSQGKSAADVVQERFWLRFRYDPTKESETREHVGRCCGQLLGSILYYARIYATIDHFRVVKNRMICDKIAGKFYLTMEEYIEQRPMWCKESCWSVLAAEWSNSEFQKNSERNRANRNSRKFKPHKEDPTLLQQYVKNWLRKEEEMYRKSRPGFIVIEDQILKTWTH